MRNNKAYKGQINGLFSSFLEKKRLKEITKYIAGNSILDFGCGYGKLASYLPDKKYIGVDKDREAIESAKMINKNNRNSQFYSINEFGNKADKFDTIVMAAVIEHIDDPVKVLINMRSYLKKCARIIITTPTPLANKILNIGSRFKLFSKEAFNEHRSLLTHEDFIDISFKVNLKLEIYKKFEFGLNQLIVYNMNDCPDPLKLSPS